MVFLFSNMLMVNYKVKDMSLAPRGRREIELAEAEMPGLMSHNMVQQNRLQEHVLLDVYI